MPGHLIRPRAGLQGRCCSHLPMQPQGSLVGLRWREVRALPHGKQFLEGNNQALKTRFGFLRDKRNLFPKVWLLSPPLPGKYLQASSQNSFASRNSYGAKQFSRGPTAPKCLAGVTSEHAFRVTENRNVSGYLVSTTYHLLTDTL